MRPIRMYPFVFTGTLLFTCLAFVTSAAVAGDWPQWRGPSRNGILPDSAPLADQWPSKGLAKLWDSEAIPCDDDGGHGSVVAANGRVYAAIVWHTDVPTETRVRMLRLIENMTGGTALAESMHGAGSPQAQKVMYMRSGNIEQKKKMAKKLAKIQEKR